jgi:AraC-like DNA-binding protein
MKVRLKAGDLLFIPPEIPHGFVYLPSRCSYLSIKFQMTSGPNWKSLFRLPPDAATTAALRQSLPLLAKSNASTETMHRLLRHLLLAAMVENGEGEAQAAESDVWVERAKQVIAMAQGRKLTVAALAGGLGISTGYLAARFRQAMRMSLKSYLDRRRADRAVELLRYSDLSISQIAETLQFPDPFTFSRFLTQQTGVSPRGVARRR